MLQILRQRLPAVDLLRIEDLLAFDLQFAIPDTAEETGFMAGMTGSATELFNLKDHRIGIAVNQDLPDTLHMSRRFPLEPQGVAGPAPEMRLPRLQGLLPGQLLI